MKQGNAWKEILRYVARRNQLKKAFEGEKLSQTRRSWHEKTASLNFEKDTQTLWPLSKTALQTDEGVVTVKAAANVFAKAYQAESEVDLSPTRVRETRDLLNTVGVERVPHMTENVTLRELEDALKKLKLKKLLAQME